MREDEGKFTYSKSIRSNFRAWSVEPRTVLGHRKHPAHKDMIHSPSCDKAMEGLYGSIRFYSGFLRPVTNKD